MCDTFNMVLWVDNKTSAKYYLFLAKCLPDTEYFNSNEKSALFYMYYVKACQFKKGYGDDLLIEQMQTDLAAQPRSLFLSNIFKIEKMNNAILYHAATALAKQGQSVLAYCMFACVSQEVNPHYFDLAHKEQRALFADVIGKMHDVHRMAACVGQCLTTPEDTIEEFIKKLGSSFEESNSVMASDRVQVLEAEVGHLKARLERLEHEVGEKRSTKHRHSKAAASSSSTVDTLFSTKERRHRSSKSEQLTSDDGLMLTVNNNFEFPNPH